MLARCRRRPRHICSQIPVLRALFPGSVTTTETIGRAMIRAGQNGSPKPILETCDINELGAS